MYKRLVKRIKWLADKLSDWQLTGWLCRVIIKLFGAKTPTYIYVVGSLAYRKHGQFIKASTIIQKALKHRPVSVPVLAENAEIQMQLLNWPRASQSWQEIIGLEGKKTKPRVWVRLAITFRQTGKPHAALLAVEKGLSYYPKDLELRIEAAKTVTQLEDWPASAAAWQLIIDRMQNKAPIDAWLGLSRALRMGGRAKDAEIAASIVYDAYRNSLPFRLEYAEIANANENWQQAYLRWVKIMKDFKIDSKFPMSLQQHVKFNISILKRLANLDDYKEEIKNYIKQAKKRKNQKLKIAVYTSYTKGYDSFKPPEYIDERFDYFAYTDADDNGMGIYEVNPLPVPGYDGSRAIRYPKTHPHVLFEGYDVAIWIDTSIMVVGDIYKVIEEFLASGKALGSTPHPVRTSLFEEFLACVDRGKDDYQILKKQLDYYQRIGFESSNLAENGLLFFNLKHPGLASGLETWWDMITRYSKRDQLSFAFAMDRNNIDWYRLSAPPDNVRTNPNFIIMPHETNHDILDKLVKAL